MNVLILGTNILNCSGAVDTILKNLLLSEKSENIHFFATAYSDKDMIQQLDKKLTSVQTKDAYRRLYYRIIRRIKRFLRIDDSLITWKYLYKRIEKLGSQIKPDYVVACSGFFDYMKAGYEYAKKHNIPLKLFYFDPYTYNRFSINKRKRLFEEKKWCDYATSIYFDNDGVPPPFDETRNKIRPFHIPIFKKTYTTRIHSNKIIYGGLFYKEIREPKILQDFLENHKNDLNDYKIEVYSNLKTDIFSNDNLSIHPLINNDLYSKKCSESAAILVIGNGNKNKSTPSKLIDAISFLKPIIGLNLNDSVLRQVEQYPLFLNGNDADCFKKLKSFESNYPNEIDIYSLFPDRNPVLLFQLLMEGL